MSPDEPDPPAVLVVEDNKETCRLLRHLLRPNFTVETVRNASSALASARTRDYHLVLMDINLGNETDGISVHRELREIDGYDAIPIVAVTAYALPGDRERFMAAGFDAYLGKPFTREQLLGVVNEVMGSSRP